MSGKPTELLHSYGTVTAEFTVRLRLLFGTDMNFRLIRKPLYILGIPIPPTKVK